MALLDSYAVVDTETTGLGDTDELIEVACITVDGGVVSARYSELVKPSLDIPQVVTDITGIDDSMVSCMRDQLSAATALMGIVGGRPIVGHNIGFDIGFIERALGSSVGNATVDTLMASRRLMRGRRSHRLGDLYWSLLSDGLVAKVDGSAHRALCDVLMTNELYRYLYGSDPRRRSASVTIIQ